MKESISLIDTVDEIISYGAKKEILQLSTANFKLNGSKISLKGTQNSQNGPVVDKEVTNFGSCSYLGLEFDYRLRQGAKDAIDCYGTQFSCSRTYISTRYYTELEGLLNKIFDAYAVVTPTTTLGHIGALPLFINNTDAVILDHQVHHSVQTAVNLIKSKGVHIELVRHNRMDLLEERIKVLRQTHKKVWYLADGIYSMFGDPTPVNEIHQLLEKYPEFHFYVDDAHGMSCFGKNGRGYVLGKMPIHERMIVAVSFAKAFATGGGALVFPTEEMARRFRTCGGPMIFSGPMQPPQLGAAIASAKIHLSDDINLYQQQLHSSIRYANSMVKKYELPLINGSDSSVFFIGVSLPKIGYKMINRMIEDGYFLNLGIFPAVPMKNSGIRFTITRNHSFRDIEKMTEALARNLKEVLIEENFSMEQIYKAFKITNSPKPIEESQPKLAPAIITETDFEIVHCNSISQIDKQLWDHVLGNRGSFNWEGMKFLEKSFTGNENEENNWVFDYIIIKDALKNPILATFLTTALWKDDMLAPEGVSAQIETQRSTDPYYLVSKVLSTGSLITAGNHLYIDRSSSLWKGALDILLKKIVDLQEKYQATSTMLRDLPQNDGEMDGFMMENGYFKINMPKSHEANLTTWSTRPEFMATLSKRMQKHIRQDVFHHEHKYDTTICKNPTRDEIRHWYDLYLNVKNKSVELNTFTLPFKMFENIAKDPNWEVIALSLKQEFDSRSERKPIAYMFSYVTDKAYNYMMVGIDYDFQEEHKPYRQAMYRASVRAKELGKEVVYLGYSASFEKRKVGAEIVESVGYMQAKDNYSMEVIESMNSLQMKKANS